MTARRLRANGIERLVDVRTADPQLLREAVGNQVDALRELAMGLDDRPVVPDRPSKSCGTESTFAADLVDGRRIREEVVAMAREDARWLVRHGVFARTVTLKVRYGDFVTITRSVTGPPTQDAERIARDAVALLARTEAGSRPVRLLGVSVHNLTETDAPPPGKPREPDLPFEE